MLSRAIYKSLCFLVDYITELYYNMNVEKKEEGVYMPPKDYISTAVTMMQNWVRAKTNKEHSAAVKYIEENVDLIDTDLQKFMDDCPKFCQLEVCEMLLKAGIDMKDYDVIRGSLKQWVHDDDPLFHQYYTYTIDYKKKLNEYIDTVFSWKADW